MLTDCLFAQIMDLSKKLAALSKPNDTIQLADLVGREAALIVGARRVATRFGKLAVVLDIRTDDLNASVFLPGRFSENLDDSDLQLIVQAGFKLKVTQEGTSSPNVNIFK